MGYKAYEELNRKCPNCKAQLKLPVVKDCVDDCYRSIGRLKVNKKSEVKT